MANAIVGLDIGTDAVHLVEVVQGEIRRALVRPLPNDLVRDGVILSYDAMGEFLKELRKSERISTRRCALCLPASSCICRRITMPVMGKEQLVYNLPYEFRDYITQGKENYFFDYAMVEPADEVSGADMDLMAAAIRKKDVHRYVDMLRQAGFRLVEAIPTEMAYIDLIRRHLSDAVPGPEGGCHGILDLGHADVRFYMFQRDRLEAVHTMGMGCARLAETLADEINVDVHIAKLYLSTNHDDVQSMDSCRSFYTSIAVDTLKAVNFFNFNHPDQELSTIRCIGGGALIPALLDTLRDMLPVTLEPCVPLIPGKASADENVFVAAALGAAIQ